MKKGFLFDINKCVACQACVVACQIENVALEELVSNEYWKQQVPWRSITTQNEFQHPELPVFNFSMACNHCEDAPCMRNCPALAYSRDSVFGAVIHHADACIGCRYCTWVCPYNAPKYNPSVGIIEKCTLCVQRLVDKRKPACASACPTGALDYELIHLSPQIVDGFPETGIQPKIQLIDLRNAAGPKMEKSTLQLSEANQKLNLLKSNKKTLLHEWPLVIFTWMMPFFVSWFYASYSKSVWVSIPWFASGLFFLGLLSLLHLGRKVRAWRAILNIRNSWLSREILAFSFFVPVSILSVCFPKQNELGLLATLLGLLILVSIDKVYRKIQSKEKTKYHSADVLFFTVFLYVAVWVANPWMFFAALTLKAYLYFARKVMFRKEGMDIRWIFSGLRITFGFLVPTILFFSLGFENSYIFIFVLLGELIDRAEFYMEL
ncbi:MAG: dimethyl sulfoxide reductase anchor subunit [Bacteroidales bacterium]|nr:dimethyl sulfoxide reductase anchor subunit [Bacteroidales bacterium]